MFLLLAHVEILIYTAYYYVYSDQCMRTTLLEYYHIFILVATYISSYTYLYVFMSCDTVMTLQGRDSKFKLEIIISKHERHH